MSDQFAFSGARLADVMVRMVVAYDGTSFRGFADNADVRTVMGVLAANVSLVVRAPVALTGAGRTDAGVHGWGQVVSGELPDSTDLDGMVRRLNKLCAPDIAVRSAEWTDDDFNARFSAQWRHYRYDVWNATTPNPLLAARAWHVIRALDVEAMKAACHPFIGEHDFSSFCRRVKVDEGEPEKSRVRNVCLAGWTDVSEHPDDGRLLRFEIRANAFCHQMVRSIVGTLVDIGLGRFTPADVAGMLDALDRSASGQVAPAHGLTLWEVGYRG